MGIVGKTEGLTRRSFESGVCVCVSCSVMSDSLQPCSPPGSSVHGILQLRIVEWVPPENHLWTVKKKLINVSSSEKHH